VEIKEIVKEPSSSAVIRFQDCDPFGHLYNSRYIDYFINAREDHLAEYYGLDIYERQKTYSENWLITKHEIAYISPVVFREEVVIRTCLLGFTENSILMEGVMLGAEGKALKSVLWTRFKYFSFAKRGVTQHPKNIMQLFEVISMGNGIDRSDFDLRAQSHRARHL
jgi:acyl-CoA thioesterase FadM